MTDTPAAVVADAPRRGRPRGSYAKTEGRRQEILAAAFEVFSTSGYRSGSLKDVADKVGLTQAGLLHHFPNKEALLEAVLTLRDEESVARTGALIAQGVLRAPRLGVASAAPQRGEGGLDAAGGEVGGPLADLVEGAERH